MSASSPSPRIATAAVASADGGRDTQQQQLIELQQRVADALRQMDDEQAATQNGRSAPTARHSDATTSAAMTAASASAVGALPPAPQPALAAHSSRSWSQRSDVSSSPPSPAPAARERLWSYLAQLPLAGVIDQRDMDALLRSFNSAEQAIAEIEKLMHSLASATESSSTLSPSCSVQPSCSKPSPRSRHDTQLAAAG